MTAPTMFVPPPVLVAKAWLTSRALFSGIDIGRGFKTPWSQWSSDFSIVLSSLPGLTDTYTPLRSRTIRVDIFGRPDNGQNRQTIPLNKLGSYAEYVVDEAIHFIPVTVNVGGISYYSVRITDISPGELPIDGPKSDAGLGRVTVELLITYMPVY